MILNLSRQLGRNIKPTEKLLLHYRSTSKQYDSIIIKRCVHKCEPPLPHAHQNSSFCQSHFVCTVRKIWGYFSPWFILRKLGIPCKHIVSFRRGLKKFTFPWIAYSIPTALALGIGDIIAQLYHVPYVVKQIKDKKGRAVSNSLQREIHLKDIDFHRTAKFMLIGLFVLGPILSRWNLFIARKLACNTTQMYILKRVGADVLLMSPFIILLGLVIWDFDKVYNSYPKLKPIWESRLRKPFWEILQFNLMTRPFIDLLLCFLVPSCLRKFIRRPYEILFFAFVSSVIAKYKLGSMDNKKKNSAPLNKKKKR